VSTVTPARPKAFRHKFRSTSRAADGSSASASAALSSRWQLWVLPTFLWVGNSVWCGPRRAPALLDTELYTRLLGLSAPWKVGEVTVAEAEQRVDVWAEHEPGARFPCPACGLLLPVYDHTPLRAWRHLDSCHFFIFLQLLLADGRLHPRPPTGEFTLVRLRLNRAAGSWFRRTG
jgi:hypothetical protein